ncbi:MAG: phage portal protein [Firmicutes bacterium]|nr:phage portal protein [Bacillota bacterium]MBQ3200244.1 phage portal protein [Bacillota bacterium]
MANKLAAFLAENSRRENVRVAVSARFLAENGEVELWELCPLSARDLQEILAAGAAEAGFAGRNLRQRELLLRMLVKSVVYPDLSSAELQDSYGVMGEEQLLLAMLSPGEFKVLEKAFARLNLDNGLNERVVAAKN